jgi:hypothetical protein
MSQNEFDRFDIGDLVRHTNWGPPACEDPVWTYGVVTAIRTHETPILPERKIEISVRYSNQYNSLIHYNIRNSNSLKKVEVVAKAKS